LISATGSAATTGFAFGVRLIPAEAFGSARGFGCDLGAGFDATTFAAFAATLGVFFTAILFEAFPGFGFETFAPVAARLPVVREERSLAAVFFGFFMATILANGARLLLQTTPGISGAQRLFDFCTASSAL